MTLPFTQEELDALQNYKPYEWKIVMLISGLDSLMNRMNTGQFELTKPLVGSNAFLDELYLTSPSGNKWKLTIDDVGKIKTEKKI